MLSASDNRAGAGRCYLCSVTFCSRFHVGSPHKTQHLIGPSVFLSFQRFLLFIHVRTIFLYSNTSSWLSLFFQFNFRSSLRPFFLLSYCPFGFCLYLFLAIFFPPFFQPPLFLLLLFFLSLTSFFFPSSVVFHSFHVLPFYQFFLNSLFPALSIFFCPLFLHYFSLSFSFYLFCLSLSPFILLSIFSLSSFFIPFRFIFFHVLFRSC